MIDLKKILSDKESIAISAHIRPDGDAFGSALAMYNYIRKKYPDKKTDIYLLDPNPLFGFLPGYEDIKTEPSDEKYDLFIALDMGDPDRLGKNKKMLDAAKDVVCVDHHLNYKNLATEANSYVVPDASSTAELVYDLVNEDLEKFYDRLEAVKDYGDEYKTYGGCREDVQCSVQFIYKTEGIGE